MASKLKTIENTGQDFDINKANCAQLRQYLRQHGLPVSGSKQELIDRVNGSFEIGKQPLEVLRLQDENFASERSRSRLLTPLGEKLPEVKSLQSGWSSDVNLLPNFSDNDLYNYLVLNSRRTHDGKPIGAKRQLKAKVFYSDRHVHSVMFHDINRTITHCYVKARVIPSIPTQKENKKDYCAWVCLSKVTGNVNAAGCDCEAGEGEACNHIAALMYGLIDITEKKKEGTNASTSKQCLWNQPRSRKLSPKKANERVFKKQKFMNKTKVSNERTSSCASSSISVEPVDTLRFFSKLKECNPHAGLLLTHEETIEKFKQPPNRTKENLGLPDPPFMFRDCVDMCSEKKVFDDYFEKLSVTSEEAENIQQKTRKQSKSLNWFVARKDRITSSNFGQIISRKELLASKSLMKSILGYTSFTCESVRWGISHEPAARRFYIKDLRESHPGITVSECGFVVSPNYPHLGASPDGLVSCSHCEETHGLLEIKCPYKYRNVSPQVAAKDKDFFCYIEDGEVKLKKSHIYYCQVQGQMALCNRKWCDFYIWTLAGRSVERIEFDKEKWEIMENKLTSFFKLNIIPEIFSRRIQRGVPT